MRFLLSLATFWVFLFLAPQTFAIVDPLAVPNNRFGIHIIDQNDFEAAAALVNSSGGDWGYVTLVIREDDRDLVKWQVIFDSLRELHLIPLLRLATVPEGSNWRVPEIDQAQPWAEFLNQLNWVVQNRYVILFNEPNHAKEWGGRLDPPAFATVVKTYATALKNQSTDFFILPGAIDTASSNSQDTLSPTTFYQGMYQADPEIFSYYDGLVSHAYPHPDFVGSVNDSGPGSIVSYRWEEIYLRDHGLTRRLPVFLTETGWVHPSASSGRSPAVTYNRLVNNYQTAYEKIWTDDNLVAITPFVLKYLSAPFAGFSWMDPDTNDPLPHHQAISALPKTSGVPVQIRRLTFDLADLPQKLISSSHYTLNLGITNSGQALLGASDYVQFTSSLFPEGQLSLYLPPLKPNQSSDITLTLNTPQIPGEYPLSALALHGDDFFPTNLDQILKIIHPPSLLVRAQLWFKQLNSAPDTTLLIYQNDRVVQKISPFPIEQGIGRVSQLTNLIPNRTYRFVLTKTYYLPRQTIATLSEATTVIEFKRQLPLDFKPDGQFTYHDLLAALAHPIHALSLLFI